MPRKFLKRFMPDPHWVRNHPHLRWLGEHLRNPNLWHLSHRSVSLAFMIGIFCAFLPMPFQMVVAATLAVLIGCNLPVSVALVWISNPVTMPAMLYFSYRVGIWILGTDLSTHPMEWHLDTLYSNFKMIWRPLILGSVICGMVAGLLGSLSIRLLWLISVRRTWIRRGRERLKRKQKPSQDV
ncbi:DUF2062 domain-containing protein [Nitrincola tapanii]|uniref:DUF2062 domain-containing protein n=1 Tax=Nitrincola tapanii TaxID=1708751 RepID=A0A5A9W3L0_9GAMM|nr:DUF2062 domain-containing protein [Nitrincola tapanii]KAA0875336.1 DUF2062 domain-containing protein [Nitrincola tapanii]